MLSRSTWQVRVKDNVREARERESNPSTSINPFTKIRLTVEQQYRDKAVLPPPPAGTRLVRLVRGEGRGVST